MTAGDRPAEDTIAGGPTDLAERAVLDLVDAGALVELTRALVAAGGENPGSTEEETVRVLAPACEERGMTVTTREVAPGRPNLVAVAGDPGAGEGLLFLGHSDVVPAGTGWSGDPFDVRVVGGRLVGRGVADMKGGLAAVLAAVDAVRRAGVGLSGPVTLACTVDEEDLDTGIRELVAQDEPVPGRYAGCVVAEPTDLDVIVACRGDAYLEVEVSGRAAHSGRPSDGRSAIAAAARVVGLVQRDHDRLLAGEQHPLVGTGTWNVGRIEGGHGTAIVAPSAHLWIDRRLMPGEDPHALAAGLREQIAAEGIIGDGIDVDVEVTMAMPGFETETSSPLVTGCVEVVRSVGRSGQVGGWTAACDGGLVAAELGIPTVVLGPGSVNDQAHQVDESVEVAELVAAARAYALLILRMLGREGQP